MMTDSLATSGEERPPKLTQHEAAFLLGRGPFLGRLAAKEKLLAYAEAITTKEGEYGPDLPPYVREELTLAVEAAKAQLAEYDASVQEPAVAEVIADPELQTESESAQELKRSLGEHTVNHAARPLRLLVEEKPRDWRERSLCAQTDPEAFHPEKGGSTREAKKVCLNCEVREECLQWALDNDERYGIWGGMSERERRKLKKRAV